MENLSKIQNTSTSVSNSKEIANKIEGVILRLRLLLVLILVLTLIYLKYILVSNGNSLVVYENLEWNTNTHTALNLYRPYGCLSGCLGGINV